ncbi:MAG: 3'-5' exonuclease [Cryomorphaceae bacterium]|nr:3'-5' exonuclease [Cryomorphaceae bacterium]
MSLKLERPLAVFDLETTGINITKDRIVEIAIIRLEVDGSETSFCKRVNPSIPIPSEITAIIGITDADVANEPKFEEIADEVVAFIGNADLAGYNSNKFDIPVLAEELMRANSSFDISARRFVDVQNIFHRMEQRTLSAAYQFYCNQEGSNYNLLDFAGRLAINEHGESIYNFGKHKGKTIKEVMNLEPGYYGWMLDADFPLYTKQCLRKEMEKIRAERAEQKESDMQSKLDALKNKFKNS